MWFTSHPPPSPPSLTCHTPLMVLCAHFVVLDCQEILVSGRQCLQYVVCALKCIWYNDMYIHVHVAGVAVIVCSWWYITVTALITVSACYSVIEAKEK